MISAAVLSVLAFIGPSFGVKLATWLLPMLFKAVAGKIGSGPVAQVMTPDQVAAFMQKYAREVPAIDPKQ